MKSKVVALLLVFAGFTLMLTSCNKDSTGLDKSTGIYWIENSKTQISNTVYYVSNSGSDKNDGLKESSAFKTIAKAISTVNPGGTVRILPGNYHESVGVESSGNLKAAVTIEGYKGTPVLDGKNDKPVGLYFQKSDNYIIKNLKFINYTDIGIGVTKGNNFILTSLEVGGNGHDVQLKGWELEGYGIHIEYSENVRIADCDVYNNGPHPKRKRNLMGMGIDTYGNRKVEIINNKSYNNTGGGMLVEDSYEVTVKENEVYGNDLDATAEQWWDGGLWLDGGGKVTVRNNYFHDNSGPGIEISDEDKQSPSGYQLIDNVSKNNYYGIFIWNFGTQNWPAESVIKRSGNDFTGNTKKDIWIEDWY